MRRRKTTFPTVYTTIYMYLPKWKKMNTVFPKYFLSFKEVHLILTGKIPEKPYAQADLDLYSLMCRLKKCDIYLGEGGGGGGWLTEKARNKLTVSTNSVKSMTKMISGRWRKKIEERSLS